MENKLNKHSILLFLALALGLSCAYWGLFFLHDHSWLPFNPSSDIMGALRGYGPSIAAFIAATVIYGRKGTSELWMRVKMWRIPLWLFVLAVLGPMIGNLVLIIIAYFSGVELQLNSESVPLPKLFIIFFFFAIVDGPVGEEIGWRGFLLPRFLERYGVIAASSLLGLVWFVWHLPLYVATDRFDITLGFFFGYLLNNVAFSFLHTWFFVRSGGSALLAIIFHTASNYFVYLAVTLFPELDQSPMTQPIYHGILVIVAIIAAISLWRNPHYMIGKVDNPTAINAVQS
ncbi:type II CAAX endopeptidase family protein [Paraglaciecola sp. 25GB23A]|uniref:CPBP family intramembrane glutamic endopeptidase n=1 Tax=Paraglaciecola sp. 25GB23A TaxID=3156068 RepID=UPI0032AFB392